MRRVPPAVVVLGVLLFSLAFQGSRGLWAPDEGRYTDVAAQMLRSGNYFVPALNAERPHFTKPPLTYWAIAAGIHVVGWNEWGARLANAIAFALTVLLAWLLGERLLPTRGWLPPLVFCTLVLPYLAANALTTDTLLTAWETLAMTGFAGWWAGGEPAAGRRWLLLMWTGFGLAFLTKGPPGLLPLLAVIVLMLLTGEHRRVGGLFYAPGLLVFLVVGLSWFVILVATRPHLLGFFVEREVVGRIATGVHHRNSQWYGGLRIYLPTLLAGALPWSVLLFRRLGSLRLLVRRHWWRATAAENPEHLLAVVWFLLPLAIFLFVRSRLPLYILPLFVPLALIIARAIQPTFSLSRRSVVLLVIWFGVLVTTRGVVAAVRSPLDVRPLAAAIAGTVAERPSEVVFVDGEAKWGLSLYLRTQLKAVSFEPGRRWADTTLDDKLGRLAPGTLFVVPENAQERFDRALEARSVASRQIGSFGDLLFLELTPVRP
jgi:4-amino-4-deoxy-L-arabinose transferase-like glycosyltransferase